SSLKYLIRRSYITSAESIYTIFCLASFSLLASPSYILAPFIYIEELRSGALTSSQCKLSAAALKFSALRASVYKAFFVVAVCLSSGQFQPLCALAGWKKNASAIKHKKNIDFTFIFINFS